MVACIPAKYRGCLLLEVVGKSSDGVLGLATFGLMGEEPDFEDADSKMESWSWSAFEAVFSA